MRVKRIPSSNLINFLSYELWKRRQRDDSTRSGFRFCIIIFSAHIFLLLSCRDYEFIVFPITALHLLWTVLNSLTGLQNLSYQGLMQDSLCYFGSLGWQIMHR
jgi:hypothetical protein